MSPYVLDLGLSVSTASVAFAVVALGITWALSLVIYRLYLHPLAKCPGPLLARMTDVWRAYYVMNGSFATKLHKMHQAYGDVVRMGPNDVSIVAPEEVKNIYGQKSDYLKGPFYHPWSIKELNHFSDRDPRTHARRRAAVASAYSMKRMLELEPFCDQVTDSFVKLMDSYDGHEIDLAKFIGYYAFDVVGEVAFGHSFGLLEHGYDHMGVMQAIEIANATMAFSACFNSLSWLLSWPPVQYINTLVLGNKGPGLIVNFSKRLVQERMAQQQEDDKLFEKRKDLLYSFLRAKHSNTGAPFSLNEVINEVTNPVGAGSDTTASTIRAFLGFVYTHPETLSKLRVEIDEAVGSGHLTFPISYGQATKLEFLQACLKEAMRLHPAIGMPLQRVVPAGGRTIGGRYYPAGTYVGLCAYEVHRDPRAYGPDAGVWRPERWLEGDRTELEKYNLVFGGGTRLCLGKNISLLEMSKLAPTFVYNYDFEFRNKEQPFKTFEHWFNSQYDGYGTIRKRVRKEF